MATKTSEKTIAKKGTKKKAKKVERSELEQKALEKWRERDKERVGPVKFKKIKEKTVTHVEEDPDKFWPQMMETVGSPDIDFFKNILSQVSSTLPNGDSEDVSNFITALMHGLKPKDETEGVLIAQMVGTHNLIMEYMKRAMIPGQYLEAANDYTNRAYKLMNLFLKQVETLEKYRGKAAQQKVIVEHVHIHEGGQAVVGHIESKPRGEGDDQEK
jgi:hypothetical protein